MLCGVLGCDGGGRFLDEDDVSFMEAQGSVEVFRRIYLLNVPGEDCEITGGGGGVWWGGFGGGVRHS